MNTKQLVGGGAVLLALAVVLAATFLQNGGQPAAVAHVYYGSEKRGLLNDPQFQQLLKDRWNLTVDGKKMGSLEMAGVDHSGVDGLWPSSELAAIVVKSRYPDTAFKMANIFNTPILFYSWPEITQALVDAGAVEEGPDGVHVARCDRLFELAIEGKPWRELGLPRQHGQVAAHPTDPTKSNSGFLLAGLLAVVLNDGRVPTMEDLPALLPRLTTYFEALGYLENSTGILFNKYLQQGQGSYPVIAAYESLIIEFYRNNPDFQQRIKEETRVLVPEPTVWSEHPFIALTDVGETLLEALQDPDVQEIAWERYGFRAATPGFVGDAAILQEIGLPQRIEAVTSLPSPEVMEAILQALR